MFKFFFVYLKYYALFCILHESDLKSSLRDNKNGRSAGFSTLHVSSFPGFLLLFWNEFLSQVWNYEL